MKKPAFSVIYEDNHLFAVDKASGVLVQGDKTGDKTLADFGKAHIKKVYNKPGEVFLGVVHRLDRPVSGAVVMAKTSKALERMNKLFRERKIKKTYWAIVKRRPPKKSATLINWLVKDEKTNTVTAFNESVKGSQQAELKYKVMGKLNDHYLLEVVPLTGRPHQIRVQLANMGCPIKGDVKYGFPKPNIDASIDLRAKTLEFIHPVKKEPLIIQAGVPSTPFWEQYLSLEKVQIKDKKVDFYK